MSYATKCDELARHFLSDRTFPSDEEKELAVLLLAQIFALWMLVLAFFLGLAFVAEWLIVEAQRRGWIMGDSEWPDAVKEHKTTDYTNLD